MNTKRILHVLLMLIFVAALAFSITACDKECEHEWKDATCTAPKTCSLCSATEGEALAHTWNNATCTAPKTCSVCSATEGEALDHSYGEWATTTEATCGTAGSKEAVCATCNDKKTETIPAKEHNAETLVKHEAVPATHTENGTWEYWSCETCDAKFDSNAVKFESEEELVILAMGHTNAIKTEAVPATHTANGTHEYWYCETCEAKFDGRAADAAKFESDEELVILAMGHTNAIKTEAVPATHTANGTHEYWYCETCDAKFDGRAADAAKFESDEELVILAMGHTNAIKVETVAATHTTNGTWEYWYCETCDAKFEGRAPEAAELTDEEITIVAMGHTNAIKTEAVPATHTANGTHEYWYCETCEAKFDGRAANAAKFESDEELVILAMGHTNAIKTEAVPATHTANGTHEYWYCETCDAKFEGRAADAAKFESDEELVILAMGHTNAIKVEAVAPTASEPGNTEYWYCETCDAKFEGRAPEAKALTDEDIYIPETCQHVYADIKNAEVIASIATVLKGTGYYKSCELCGKVSATEIFYDSDVVSGYEFDEDKLPDGLTIGTGWAIGGVVPTTGIWARVISDEVGKILTIGKVYDPAVGNTHNIKITTSVTGQYKYVYQFAMRWNFAENMRSDNVPVIVKFSGVTASAHSPKYQEGKWIYGSAAVEEGTWTAIGYEFIMNADGTGYDARVLVDGKEALSFTATGTATPVVVFETRYSSKTDPTTNTDMSFDMDKLSIAYQHKHEASNVVAMKFLKAAATDETTKNVYYKSCAGCGEAFDDTFEYGTINSIADLSQVPNSKKDTDGNANGITDGRYMETKSETITNVKGESVTINYVAYIDDYDNGSTSIRLNKTEDTAAKKSAKFEFDFRFQGAGNWRGGAWSTDASYVLYYNDIGTADFTGNALGSFSASEDGQSLTMNGVKMNVGEWHHVEYVYTWNETNANYDIAVIIDGVQKLSATGNAIAFNWEPRWGSNAEQTSDVYFDLGNVLYTAE